MNVYLYFRNLINRNRAGHNWMKSKLKDELSKNHRLNHYGCTKITILRAISLKQGFLNY